MPVTVILSSVPEYKHNSERRFSALLKQAGAEVEVVMAN